MGPHMYLYEKAREVHSQDLLRQAEKERLLAQLPRHRQNMIKQACCWETGHTAAQARCQIEADRATTYRSRRSPMSCIAGQ
jgi:hypothetical protein